MGTRGFVGYVVNDKAVYSYQQYDSYPSGVGLQTLGFLRKIVEAGDVARFRAFAGDMRVVTDGEDATPSRDDKDRYAHLSDGHVSSGADWYATLRGLQGDIGKALDEGVILQASERWPADSLFCEWGYLINFDAETLEVYQGFQHGPHSAGRFADLPLDPSSPGYHPVALRETYRFDALPTDEVFETLEHEDTD